MKLLGYIKNLFSFRGTLSQKPYIIIFVAFWSLCPLFYYLDDNSGLYSNIVLSVLDIPLLWIFCAAKTKRCRYLGMSGWRQLLPLWGLFILLNTMRNKSFRTIITIISALIYIPILLIIGILLLFSTPNPKPQPSKGVTTRQSFDKSYEQTCLLVCRGEKR